MGKTIQTIICFIAMTSMFSACTTVEKNSSTPEGSFAIAQEFESSERFDEAVRRYSEIKNKFPYSSFAARAELAIADVYFKQESYAEAQVSYQVFKDMHPTYPQSDYVQYRIAMSCFEQLPNSIDRDLSLANETILNFSEIIKKYPGSSYVTEAKEKRSTVIRMLAQKEEYIADFYFKRNIYESALARYEGLYKNYSGLGFDEKALLRIVISAHKKADAAKAQKYFKILAQDFPGTPEFKLAEKELK